MIFHGRLHRLFALGGALAIIAGAFFIAPVQAQQTQQGTPPAAGQQHPAPLQLPPMPQPNRPAEKKFGDWVKRCEPARGDRPGQCYISQVVILTRNNKRHGVLFVAIGYYGPKRTPGAILRVPLGLATFLPRGLVLHVPGAKALRVAIETCLPGGCNAAAKLTPEMISAMQKADRGNVEVHTIRKQKLMLPVSFKGFTAGFASLAGG